MPNPDDYDPNAPIIPDELREKLFTKPSHALGEPTKALQNALIAKQTAIIENEALRARIAALEAELAALREKLREQESLMRHIWDTIPADFKGPAVELHARALNALGRYLKANVAPLREKGK